MRDLLQRLSRMKGAGKSHTVPRPEDLSAYAHGYPSSSSPSSSSSSGVFW